MASKQQPGVKNLLIEGDNATAIRALRGEISTPWTIAAINKDVNKFLITMASVSISHVYREANIAADWLSKTGQTVFNSNVN